MDPGPKPSAYETGRAIGTAAALLTDRLSGAVNSAWLAEAAVSPERYRAELLLLAAAAALHGIESSGLAPAVESDVASGIFDWARSLEQECSALLLAELSHATDYYAEAASLDEANPPRLEDPSEVEMAFGDRLFALGTDTETRGHACARLSLVTPKALWPAQCSGSKQMLIDALLVRQL